MSDCCSTRIIQISSGSVDFSTLTAVEITQLTQSVDFAQLTLAQQLAFCAAVANCPGAVTTMVDNLDGTFTYTSEDGTVTVIGAAGVVTTLVDNGNDTYTYTSENGTTTLIDARDVTTTLVDNLNGSFTYTNEVGTAVTYTEELTTLVYGANGVYTYTNESGVLTTFMAVNPVTTAALLPNPTTVAAGGIYTVNSDANPAFNGIYKVDGIVGSNGVGYTKI